MQITAVKSTRKSLTQTAFVLNEWGSYSNVSLTLNLTNPAKLRVAVISKKNDKIELIRDFGYVNYPAGDNLLIIGNTSGMLGINLHFEDELKFIDRDEGYKSTADINKSYASIYVNYTEKTSSPQYDTILEANVIAINAIYLGNNPDEIVIVNSIPYKWRGSGYFPALTPESPNVGYYRVRWFDYRGNIIAQQWAASGETLENPTAPKIDGLTFHSWSTSASNINSNVDIIAVYLPSDGKQTIFVEASPNFGVSSNINEASAPYIGMLPNINIVKSDSSELTIDWGDGTTAICSEQGAIRIFKNEPYVEKGAYVIKLHISNGEGTFTIGLGTPEYPLIENVSVTEYWANDSVTDISNGAFSGIAFRTMKYTTGFSSTINIGNFAFQNCYALKAITIPLAASIGVSAFQNNNSLILVSLPMVNYIDFYAFQNCHSLTSISFPLTLSMPLYTFESCYSLDYIVFSNLKQTSAFTFQYCQSLKIVHLPSIISLDTGTFQYCYSMTSIIIGPDCRYIGPVSMNSLRNLISLRIEAITPPEIYDNSLIDYDPRLIIYVPNESIEAYKNATNWSTYASRFVGF